jgi:hypothetical protein
MVHLTASFDDFGQLADVNQGAGVYGTGSFEHIAPVVIHGIGAKEQFGCNVLGGGAF